ncbi:MAG: WecB/TagA/CpsF family glycosyltransferase [Chitinophagaceae bacterium]|nr:WecB/TagA/CpsF family glycosyltransferase [Chitinophagaceae bacterium]
MDERFNFLGVSISATNLPEAADRIMDYHFKSPGYICFPDASVINEANRDPVLRSILNNAFITMPDGKPSQLVARLQGLRQVTTVSGFHLCNNLLQSNLTHYFYGGNEEVITRLKHRLSQQYPEAHIIGYKAAPFVAREAIEANDIIKADIEEINRLKPNLVWIGISSPKQDYLMHYFHNHLDRSLMLGIGGAFLYFSDEKLKSPEWLKKAGLRWAYRLCKEPLRLWPKYYSTFKFLVSNSIFFVRIALKGRKS